MELTVLERLTLLRILPHRGNLTTLRIVRDLERDLSFSEEEHGALQFQQDGNVTRWNEGAVPDKDVSIGPKAIEIVVGALEELDKVGALQMEMIDLCDKFGYEGKDDSA